MRRTYITAIAIAVGVVIWIASGVIGGAGQTELPSVAERNVQRGLAARDRGLATVRARVVEASPQTAYASIRGRTQNKRTVEVRAETVGRVVERPVERGDRVQAGQALCRLALDDRNARLVEAREAVNQARIEYRGSLELKEKGYNSEAAIATAKARLAAAAARLKSMQIDIVRTEVQAPFDSVVEVTHVEVGDYLRPGEPCVTLVDLDPMLLVGQVAERDVSRMNVGGEAFGELVTGERLSGRITFVGQQADPATRTYRVEVAVANPDYALRSGITTDLLVPAETRMAHRVSPALFTLDDAGAVVVRTVDADRRVAIHHVDVLRGDGEGTWVTGLPTVATLITVGHEYVVPGEAVHVDYERAPPIAGPSSRLASGEQAPAARTRASFSPAVEANPQEDAPSFSITIVHEGSSPEDSARLLALPVEMALRAVEGIEEVRAFPSQGVATVLVEFNADYDLDIALADVRAAVARAKPELPVTAEEPIIVKQSADAFPSSRVSVVGDAAPERMRGSIAKATQEGTEATPSTLWPPAIASATSGSAAPAPRASNAAARS